MAEKKEIAVEVNKIDVTVQDVLNDKAKQSSKNILENKKLEKISLKDTIDIVFTKDYGFMKKDQEATVSALAFEVYSKAEVAKKK